MERIELGGHREVKGGIWLPTSIRNIQFDFRAKTAEGRQRRAIDGSLRLLAVQVNEDVPAELFHFAAPPGAVVGSAERPADPDKPRRGGSRGSLGGMVREYSHYNRVTSSVTRNLVPFGCAVVAIMVMEIVFRVVRRRCSRRV